MNQDAKVWRRSWKRKSAIPEICDSSQSQDRLEALIHSLALTIRARLTGENTLLAHSRTKLLELSDQLWRHRSVPAQAGFEHSGDAAEAQLASPLYLIECVLQLIAV